MKTASKAKAPAKEQAKAKGSKVQGEGDYEAARHYRAKTKNFIASHDVEKVARAAAPRSSAEARSMQAAETAGKAKSRARPKSSTATSKRASDC